MKEYERTNDRIYKAHRSAIEDRTKFETQARNVERLLEAAQKSAQEEREKSRDKIAVLEGTIARAAAGPSSQDQPATDAQLKDAQLKILALEKRLENAQRDADYARTMYQDASSAASSVGAENRELKERAKDLQQTASDNLVKIHQIQADSNTKEYLRRIHELKLQVRDREVELDRARDELRQLKNGRQTRQVSVPRSPRMGMMSPRRGIGGSASRGTSPAPAIGIEAAAAAAATGMQFMAPQQPGNGRWQHLRE